MVDDDGPGPPAALPMGFPGCRRCWWRAGADPQVCLACYQAGAEGRGDAGCPVCGQPLRSGERCPNRWCGRADRAFSAAFSVGTYQGDLRRAVVAYKYGGERWWANAFANLLAAYLDSHATWFEEFDLIVAMPAYLGPGARRGWDPVGLVVAALGRLAQGRWEVNPGLVQKLAETPAMSGRTWWERERDGQGALRRALRVTDPRAVQGAAILVVDDVFTGGSSLHEVARALQGAGAAEVAGLVLARPAWRGPARPDPPGLARCGNPKPGRVAQDGDLAGTAIPRGCRRSVARVSEAVRVSVAEVRAAIPSGLGVEAGLVVLQEDLP
ncbi:MAG: ComF family protein, partial [Acidimicrobiales bacterium]